MRAKGFAQRENPRANETPPGPLTIVKTSLTSRVVMHFRSAVSNNAPVCIAAAATVAKREREREKEMQSRKIFSSFELPRR